MVPLLLLFGCFYGTLNHMFQTSPGPYGPVKFSGILYHFPSGISRSHIPEPVILF